MLGDRPRIALQEMGVLARPIFETIYTNLPLRLQDQPLLQDLTEENLELLDRILAVQTDNTQRPPGDPQAYPADRREP